MAIYNLFSKRRKAERGEIPDVYQYTKFEMSLKVQIVHIIKDAFGNNGYSQVKEKYGIIKDALCREYGVFELYQFGSRADNSEHVIKYFLNEEDIEKSFDVIELCFRAIENIISDDYSYKSQYQVQINAVDAVKELNERFKEHGFGYIYESGIVMKITSEYAHSEIVKPALRILNDKRFRGPQQEFLSAHSHFRNKENKECINECLKSLESTIKVICKEKKIGIGENSTAKTLINTLFENEYIPKYFQSHYSALQSVLESGVPTVRNKVSGHGQGDKIIDVDENYAELILNLTATNIIFLASGIK